ncbi:MAG: hypothetical protein RL264_646 [Bacteroidota bacterium]|jgi:tetratricopeptide (TPR) repeat protein
MEKTKELIYDVVTDIRYGTVSSKTINKLKRLLKQADAPKETKYYLAVCYSMESEHQKAKELFESLDETLHFPKLFWHWAYNEQFLDKNKAYEIITKGVIDFPKEEQLRQLKTRLATTTDEKLNAHLEYLTAFPTSTEAKKYFLVFLENEQKQIDFESLKQQLDARELDEKFKQRITKLLPK